MKNLIQLSYLGNSCVCIITSDSACIVSEPYGDNRPDGLADLPVDLKADTVNISHIHSDQINFLAVQDNQILLTEPGDYPIKSTYVTAFLGWEGSPEGPNPAMRNVIFVFESFGAKVVQLGDSGVVDDPKVLTVISNADLVLDKQRRLCFIPHSEALPFMKRIHSRTILLAHNTLTGHEIWCGAPTADEFIQTHPSGWKTIRTASLFEISPGIPQQITVLAPQVFQ